MSEHDSKPLAAPPDGAAPHTDDPGATAPAPPRGLRERIREVVADLRANPGGPEMDWRTVLVLLATPALLTVFYYYGRPVFFRRELQPWAEATWGADWEFLELAAYGYWAMSSMLLRVLVPMLLIVVVMRERLRDYGFRWSGTIRHAPIYTALMLVMVPILYWASLQGSFQDKYPFYDRAHLGGWHFWGYELFYFVQFFALEAFFRGFMLFGLAKRFGYYSVMIMCVPYCMIHFNKPLPETLGAIVAGAVLGVLALRSGSFYLGVILHFGVAILMDVLALWQAGAL